MDSFSYPVEAIKSLVEYLKSYFQNYDLFIVLTGYRCGGRFILSDRENAIYEVLLI